MPGPVLRPGRRIREAAFCQLGRRASWVAAVCVIAQGAVLVWERAFRVTAWTARAEAERLVGEQGEGHGND